MKLFKPFLTALLFFALISGKQLYAQHIAYDPTYFGNYVPSPPYEKAIMYVTDSTGYRIEYNDSLLLSVIDSDQAANIHWEEIIKPLYSPNRQSYFRIRYVVNNENILAKTIQVTNSVWGLFNSSNLRDSIYIYYSYDSSSGRYLYKSILTQLASTTGGSAQNLQKTDYYYDQGYNDTLELHQRWDKNNNAWTDSAKTVAVFTPSMGVPQYYQHFVYLKSYNSWKLASVDSMVYDSAANPKFIMTKVNVNGKMINSSGRYIRRIHKDTVENYHYVWNDSVWVKDTEVIMHFDGNGIKSKLVKLYDASTQLVWRAIKCNYGDPFYEDINDASEAEAGIHIYPNPVLANFHIAFENPEAGNMEISVYDLMGRQVKYISSNNIPQGTHTEEIDMQSMPAGMYIVRVHTKNTYKEVKVIKVKE